MNVNIQLENKNLTIKIEGRLDTTTAPILDEKIKSNINGVETLILDCLALEYISSAGLRVLLATQKIMNVQGSMTVKNVNDNVMEVFEITGFSDILNIEK